ncbi:hypothetical protein [Nocardioides soli]|uniref:Uncharacterized protein n=1 Tax=Nocardioides soli TaxID=1036020 RepID=A0A7W4VSK9_9ACTN|nr:hypothetical protein [Nocardioides soli]MBB3040991.1 hypothetical protein [Nocardioides soli]
MAKMRGFKPEIWTDDKFVELSSFARLLFMGMWNYACDNGHLDDKPKQIKMRVLPTDPVDAEVLLAEMLELGMVVRDDAGLTIPKLREHQRLDNRYFTWCDRCELDEIPEPARSKHPRHTSGTRRAHDVTPTSTRVVTREGRKEGSREGEGEGSVGDLTTTEPTRPEIDAICEHLADEVEATGSKRPAITEKWRREARLMLDRDGRTAEQVHACIRWLYASNHPDAIFWRPNVRAIPKLRAEWHNADTDRRKEIEAEVAALTPTEDIATRGGDS